LAFALRAVRTPPLSQSWRNEAEKRLKLWELEYEDLGEITPPKELLPSAFKPDRESTNAYIRASPVITRSKRSVQHPSSCRPVQGERASADSSDEDEAEHESPSQRPRQRVMVVPPPAPSRISQQAPTNKGKSRQYCTLRCLLGLAKGGPLDKSCPNVADHGTDEHQIDQPTFVSLLKKQILETVTGCESLHKHGTRGALFEVTLLPYGYTLVGKGFPAIFRLYMSHENTIYECLAPIQGIHVPVCLGTIDLTQQPLWYDGIAAIPYFLLLSHAGIAVSKSSVDKKQISQTAAQSLQAIHKFGIRHCDAHTNNMFWSAENEGVLFIDFERAEIYDKRQPLEVKSPNHKRRRGETGVKRRQSSTSIVFDREMRELLRQI
jgi:hypothetical protein